MSAWHAARTQYASKTGQGFSSLDSFDFWQLAVSGRGVSLRPVAIATQRLGEQRRARASASGVQRDDSSAFCGAARPADRTPRRATAAVAVEVRLGMRRVQRLGQLRRVVTAPRRAAAPRRVRAPPSARATHADERDACEPAERARAPDGREHGGDPRVERVTARRARQRRRAVARSAAIRTSRRAYAGARTSPASSAHASHAASRARLETAVDEPHDREPPHQRAGRDLDERARAHRGGERARARGAARRAAAPDRRQRGRHDDASGAARRRRADRRRRRRRRARGEPHVASSSARCASERRGAARCARAASSSRRCASDRADEHERRAEQPTRSRAASPADRGPGVRAGAGATAAPAARDASAAVSPPLDDKLAMISESDHGSAGPHGSASFASTTSQSAACQAGRSRPARVSTNATSASSVPCPAIMPSVASQPLRVRRSSRTVMLALLLRAFGLLGCALLGVGDRRSMSRSSRARQRSRPRRAGARASRPGRRTRRARTRAGARAAPSRGDAPGVDERLARLVDLHRALRGEPAEQRHHGRVRELVAARLQLGADLGDRALAELPQRLHDAELGRGEVGAAGHGYDDLRSITTTVVTQAQAVSIPAARIARYSSLPAGRQRQVREPEQWIGKPDVHQQHDADVKSPRRRAPTPTPCRPPSSAIGAPSSIDERQRPRTATNAAGCSSNSRASGAMPSPSSALRRLSTAIWLRSSSPSSHATPGEPQLRDAGEHVRRGQRVSSYASRSRAGRASDRRSPCIGAGRAPARSRAARAGSRCGTPCPTRCGT